MTAQAPEPLDVAELRRLVDGQDGSSAMRQNLVSWLNGHAVAILAALEEREGLRRDVRRLRLHFDEDPAAGDALVITTVEQEIRADEIPAIRDLLAAEVVAGLPAAREAEEGSGNA
jgi:hypothetical protein